MDNLPIFNDFSFQIDTVVNNAKDFYSGLLNEIKIFELAIYTRTENHKDTEKITKLFIYKLGETTSYIVYLYKFLGTINNEDNKKYYNLIEFITLIAEKEKDLYQLFTNFDINHANQLIKAVSNFKEKEIENHLIISRMKARLQESLTENNLNENKKLLIA